MLSLLQASVRTVFDHSGAFERAELHYFDVRLRQSQSGGRLTYRKIEEKTAGEHVAVMCGQCLHEAFHPLARVTTDDVVQRWFSCGWTIPARLPQLVPPVVSNRCAGDLVEPFSHDL